MRIFLFILIFSTGCTSTTVMQERVEKMRIGVPALLSVEIDYYKDAENQVEDRAAKNPPTKTYVTPLPDYPKLMPMNRK